MFASRQLPLRLTYPLIPLDPRSDDEEWPEYALLSSSAKQINSQTDSDSQSFRVVGLSVVLSLTTILFVFYILKMIWQRFRIQNSEALLADSSLEEETILVEDSEYGHFL